MRSEASQNHRGPDDVGARLPTYVIFSMLGLCWLHLHDSERVWAKGHCFPAFRLHGPMWYMVVILGQYVRHTDKQHPVGPGALNDVF